MTKEQYDELLVRFGSDNVALFACQMLGYEQADYRRVEMMCQIAGELVCSVCGATSCEHINNARKRRELVENIPPPLKITPGLSGICGDGYIIIDDPLSSEIINISDDID